VGAFEREGSGYMTEANWHIESATTSLADAWWNLYNSGFPTDGANSISFQITRDAGGAIRAGYSQSSTGFSTFHEMDVSGTALGLTEDLLVAVVVNDRTIVNIDYIRSAYMPATPGPGGDGVTGLESTPSGNLHTFVWDTFSDLVLFGAGANVQFRIRAYDLHGWGVADESESFGVLGGIGTGVDRWMLYR